MKKFFAMILILSFATGCLFSGCAGELKFELDAAVYYREVWQGERFVVVVTTKNTGRTYRYRGSSTIVGAAAELYCETPDGVFYLICDPGPISADSTVVKIRRGEVISHVWYFEAKNTDGLLAPLGIYDLKLTYLGEPVVKENFLEIKARSAQQNAGGEGRKLSALSFLKPKAGGIH